MHYKRAKIFFDQSHKLAQLNNLDIPTDHGIKKDGTFIISDFSSQELETARDNGFEVKIILEDVKAFYRSQNSARTLTETSNTECSSNGTPTYETPTNFNQGSMGGYLTYQELLDELDDMVAEYPNLISTKTPISNFLTEGQPDTSVTPSIGSNPIYWVKISDNPNSDEAEPEILYTSIHHAREPMSLMQLVFYMWYLLENYEDNAEIQSIVNNTELYFIPVVNPDGYLYNQVTDPNGGGLWRKNRKNGNGVDNNRNYDYHINGDSTNGSWGGPGSSSNPNSQTYRGTGPFSEVENQAIKWFVEQHEFKIALNNHTFGQLLYFPFGYADVATPDEDLYLGLGAELTSVNGYTPIRDNPFAGESDDFMYGTVGTHDKIFAFTPEIGTSFWPPASAIESTSQGMMFLNLTTAQMTINYGALTENSPTFVGESTSLSTSFNLQRLGIASTGDFTITFSPISSNILSNGNAITLSELAPLETQSGSITYTVDSSIEIGEAIEFDLIVDNGLFENPIRISKVYGSTNDILSINGDDTSDFESTEWGITSSTFVSPSSSITDSPSGVYSNNANSTITLSEAVDLTDASTAVVSFYTTWDIEDTWDYVQFEISKDNGVTWEPQCGNYTSQASNIQPTGEPLYDGSQTEWVLEEINLSNYLGETIIARFELITDSEVTRDGFYFDDLEFSIISNDPLRTTENAFANLFVLFPNPVSDVLTISTSLGAYKTIIHNVLGQEISSIQDHSGNSTIDYSSFPIGLYFVRIESETKSTVLKILKR